MGERERERFRQSHHTKSSLKSVPLPIWHNLSVFNVEITVKSRVPR